MAYVLRGWADPGLLPTVRLFIFLHENSPNDCLVRIWATDMLKISLTSARNLLRSSPESREQKIIRVASHTKSFWRPFRLIAGLPQELLSSTQLPPSPMTNIKMLPADSSSVHVCLRRRSSVQPMPGPLSCKIFSHRTRVS